MGHVWVNGSIAAWICADIYGPCYHQRPYGCPGSGLLPEIMLMSEYCAELPCPNTFGNMALPLHGQHGTAGNGSVGMGDMATVEEYRKTGLTPDLGSTVELTLVAWVPELMD